MSLLRKAILVNGAALVCLAVSILQTALLTRVLGPEGIGQYSVIIATAMLATQLCCLGFPLSFLYYSQHDSDNTQNYLMNAIWSCLALGLLGGVALAAIVSGRDAYFGPLPWFALLALAVHVPVELQGFISRNVLMIDIEAKRLSLMRLAVTIGFVSLLLIVYVAGFLEVGQALACFVGMGFIRLGLGGYWMRKLLSFRIKPKWQTIKKLGLMGIRQSWADLMVLVNAQVNVLMVKYFMDFDNVGYFSRGQRVAMLAVIAGQAVLPLLFSRWAAFPADKLVNHVEKVMRFATTVAFLMALSVLIGGRWIVLLLFGQAFLPSVAPMKIMICGAALYLLSRVLMQLLGSKGRPEISAGVLAIAATMNIALAWWLIPSWGIVGAAWASTASHVVTIIALALIVKKCYGIRIQRCVWMNRADYRNMWESIRRR